MGAARERASQDKAERGKRVPARVAATAQGQGPIFDARGLAFDRLGNRAVVALFRAGQVRRKARVSEPGDPAEREADRAADAVLAGERPPPLHDGRAPSAILTKEADATNAPAPERTGRMGGAPPPDEAEQETEALAAPTGGSRLEEPTRAAMERHFEASFAAVRIHTGPEAADAAAALNARAFTMGRDIVFGDGEFAPETARGRHLLAHELAHVMQQSQAGSQTVQRQPAPRPEPPDSRPSVVAIYAYRMSKTGARALLSDDTVEAIEITDNELEAGDYTLQHVNEGKYRGAGARFYWWNPREPVTKRLKYAWADMVRVIVQLTVEERIAALPPDIRRFLTASDGPVASAAEIEKVAIAGEILAKFGVTGDELLLLETRQQDLAGVGLAPAKTVDPVAWALNFVTTRAEVAKKQQDNFYILTEVAKRFDEADPNIVGFIRRGGLLQIVEPGSDRIALSVDLAIRRLGGFAGGGRAELAGLLSRLEQTLLADLRRLATGMLDSTEAGLLRIDRAFVGIWRPKRWGPGYLWSEIERARQDPELQRAAAERDAVYAATDAEDFHDRQVKLFHDRTIDLDTYKANKARREQQRKDADDRYRAIVGGRSMLKLSSASEISSLLAAKNEREAQSQLALNLADWRAKVKRAREYAKDDRKLYAADVVIAAEKEQLAQQLGAEHARVVNALIDQLARERRSQTSIWDDIWNILKFVAMFVPGPAGLALRIGMAAVDFDERMKDIAFRNTLYGAGIRSVGADPGEALAAVAEFGVQVIPDVALSKPFAAGERTALDLGQGGRAGERELAQVGERQAANLESKGGRGTGGEPAAPPSGGGPSGGAPSGGAEDIRGVRVGGDIRIRGEPPPPPPVEEIHGTRIGDYVRIRGQPALQPTAEAVKNAEAAVTELVNKKYGHLGLRDISDPTKHVYEGGVDRFFIVGQGEGAVLLEVDAKLSIQGAPVTIGEVSAFQTAARTGGESRLELLDGALKKGHITPDEYRVLRSDIESGVVLEEVHGFGSVKGISQELRQQGVTYVQGEQFAHITTQIEAQQSRQLSIDISTTLVAPAADKRGRRQIANQIWKDFEQTFGRAAKPPRKPRKPKAK